MIDCCTYIHADDAKYYKILWYQFVLSFYRRKVNIDLQWLIDEDDASLSINCGGIDVLMHDPPADTNKKVIRVIDEQ